MPARVWHFHEACHMVRSSIGKFTCKLMKEKILFAAQIERRKPISHRLVAAPFTTLTSSMPKTRRRAERARDIISNFTIRKNMLHILCIFLLNARWIECMSFFSFFIFSSTTFRNSFSRKRNIRFDVGRARGSSRLYFFSSVHFA